VNGFTTIHAGSARQALSRLRFICQLADTARELPLSALNTLVSEAVDLVVYCTRTGDRVRVSEIIAVEDLQTAADSASFTVTELFGRGRPDAELRWTGSLPSRATRALEAAGYDALVLLDPEERRRGRASTDAGSAASSTPGRQPGWSPLR
jgi:pilus assembly protein CpaF